MTHHLLGSKEVAELLGVSRQRLHQLVVDTRASFPEPVATLSVGRIWMREDIDRWIAAHPGRRLAPDEGIRCSFCGALEHDRKRLIHGPGVFICEECIARSVAIIVGDMGWSVVCPSSDALYSDLSNSLPVNQLERAIQQLPDVEQRVLRLRFGSEESAPLSVADVASKLELSPSSVRDIEDRALDFLRGLER